MIISARYINTEHTEVQIIKDDGAKTSFVWPRSGNSAVEFQAWLDVPNTIADYDLALYKNDKLGVIRENRGIAADADITVDVGGTDYTFEAKLFDRVLAGHTVTALSAGMSFPADYRWMDTSGVLRPFTEARAKELAKLMLQQEYTAQRHYWDLQMQVNDPMTDTKAKVDLIPDW